VSKYFTLGLDLGTQSVKGVLVDGQGIVHARAQVNRPPRFPQEGWVEMDAELDWFAPAVEVIRTLLADQPERARGVLAVGVCGLVPCLCPLDGEGQPLRPAILYADNRALDDLAQVPARLALTAEALTPKLLWLKRREPQVYAAARKVLSAHNYVVYRLTGRMCVDYDTASIFGGIFDPRSKTWDQSALAELGLKADLWPDLLPATAAAGEVSAAAARLTGLLAGTPVLTGTGDTFPSIVGCGAVEPGDAMISAGTSGLLTLTQRPLLESVMGPHFDDGSGLAAVRWAANVLSAGQLVSWYASLLNLPGTQCAVEDEDLLRLLEEGARQVPPGAEGLLALPHWQGRRSPQPDAHVRGGLIGLTPRHSDAHIYRALLESFGYNLRQGLDPIRAEVKRVVITGGGAKSPLWREILAGILEVEVEFSPCTSTALGMAFLAAWGVGGVHDFDTVRTLWLGQMELVQPDGAAGAAYRRAYAAYQVFDQALAQGYARTLPAMEEVRFV
jgi:xylulokinase